jgi:hypothetical protein
MDEVEADTASANPDRCEANAFRRESFHVFGGREPERYALRGVA